MKYLLLVILILIIVCFVIIGCLAFILKNERKKRFSAEENLIKAEAALDWEKTKAEVKKDVDNEIKKKSEKLNTGSKPSRINAAGDILCNKN